MTKYKFAVIGDEGAGKTKLVNSLKGDVFSPVYNTTVGANFDTVELTRRVTLEIWDTAGQERYQTLRSMYTRGVGIVLYCVDFSIKQPDIEKIKQEIKVIKGGDGLVGEAPNATVILVATKCDLYPDNAQTIVEQLARDVGVDLCTITSAKTGVGFVKRQGQTLLTDLILANLPAQADEEAKDFHPRRRVTAGGRRETLQEPIIPTALQEIAQPLFDSLRGGNLTRKQRNQIYAAIIVLDQEILQREQSVTHVAKVFSDKCHTILEGKHPYIMNAVYAFAGAVVVAGVIATAGILGLGVAAVVPVALVSCIWGGATGALISNGLFSRALKQARDADAVLNNFATQLSTTQLNRPV